MPTQAMTCLPGLRAMFLMANTSQLAGQAFYEAAVPLFVHGNGKTAPWQSIRRQFQYQGRRSHFKGVSEVLLDLRPESATFTF